MRKKLLFCLWLLAPVALLAYHYGPGQMSVAREAAGKALAKAEAHAAQEEWKEAMAAYTDALAKVPATDKTTRWQVRLAQGKLRIESGEIPEAAGDLESLLAEMEKENAPAKNVDDVRANLAKASYYVGWLMRLEGAKTEEWTPQVENARQNYRLLAENALKSDPSAAKGYQENLEATIRLARMDLTELESLPLPKNCQNCKNACEKCRSQSQAKAKKPAEKESEPKDARSQGVGQRPKGGS